MDSELGLHCEKKEDNSLNVITQGILAKTKHLKWHDSGYEGAVLEDNYGHVTAFAQWHIDIFLTAVNST